MRAIYIIGVIAMFLVACGGSNTESLNSFAKCLDEKGAKMYGAYWCSHCTQQKQLFGPSWQYVNYEECSLPNRAGMTQSCQDAGISGYPTWEFPDGTRQSGVVSLQQLGDITGCVL